MSASVTKSYVPTPLYIKYNMGRDYVDDQIASLVYQWLKWRGWSAAGDAPEGCNVRGDLISTYKYDFFSPLLNNVSDKNKKRNTADYRRGSTSEMFMGKPKYVCTSSFALYIHIYYILSFFATVFVFLFLFFFCYSHLSFPINLTQILVDEGYRGVIY